MCIRDRPGRGDRTGIPHLVARRDRLAGYSAERIAQLPAERFERQEDFELHHPQGGRSLAGALHDDACGLRTEMGRSEDLHRIRHYHRRKVRREGREFHAVEDDRRQVFHRRRVQGGRQRQPDRQERYGRFPLCGRSRREKFVPRIGQDVYKRQNSPMRL